jgi:hypothetical protein
VRESAWHVLKKVLEVKQLSDAHAKVDSDLNEDYSVEGAEAAWSAYRSALTGLFDLAEMLDEMDKEKRR